jgi:hypothetical protein
VTPAELESLLAADLTDETTRLVLSDALTDLDREEEVALCRDLSRHIRAADLGRASEGEPRLGWRVVDFDHTRVEWLPSDSIEVREVRGPWEATQPEPASRRSEALFMLWHTADEPGRTREGWEAVVVYLAPFPMAEAHGTLFRAAVREDAVANGGAGGRTWAIRWPDGVIEQEPQPLALVGS